MFSEAYASAQANLALSGPINGVEWLATSHMSTGRIMNNMVSSLAAFWPGLQALAGQVEDGLRLHVNWTTAWNNFKWLPESFSFNALVMHPTMTAYPLRPELAESTFLLHAATGKPGLLQVSRQILERLRDGTKARCGHASVADAGSSRLEDTMESFFLSETTKYLYLTFANASRIVDEYVLSTEGHLFPPFLPQTDEEIAAEGSMDIELPVGEESTCDAVCNDGNNERSASGRGGVFSSIPTLRSALPLVPTDPAVPQHLRRRRCITCKEVTRALAVARKRSDEIWRWDSEGTGRAGRPHVAPQQWSLNKLNSGTLPKKIALCVLVEEPGKLHCSLNKVILSSQLTSQAVQAVPHNTVFFQVMNASTLPSVEAVANSLSEVQIFGGKSFFEDSQNAPAAAADGGKQETCDLQDDSSIGHEKQIIGLPAMVGEFGPDLLPGCNSSDASEIMASRNRWREMVAANQAVAVGIEDDEEPSEEGESEEVVKMRIKAIEKGEIEIVLPESPTATAGGNDGSGTAGVSPGSVLDNTDDDDDPYLDPDDDEEEEDEDPYLDVDDDDDDKEESTTSDNHANDRGTCTNPDQPKEASKSTTPPPAAATDAENAQKDLEPSDAYIDVHTVCEARGPLVLVQPSTGCTTPLENADKIPGSIAIIMRGQCSFQNKVLAAQNAGAVGVIVVNVDLIPGDGMGSSLMPMGGEAVEGENPLPQPQIISVMVRDQEGEVILQAAKKGLFGRINKPLKERKLELAAGLLNALENTQRELKVIADAIADKAAVEKVAAEKAAAPAGVDAAEGATTTEAEEHTAVKEENRAPVAAEANMSTLRKPSLVQLEVIIPPNSQVWVMHQLYQAKMDMTPAFTSSGLSLMAHDQLHEE